MPVDDTQACREALQLLRRAGVSVKHVERVFAPDRYHPETEILYLSRRDNQAETAYVTRGREGEPIVAVGW